MDLALHKLQWLICHQTKPKTLFITEHCGITVIVIE